MKKAYFVSLTITIISTSLAVITIIPWSMASYSNLIGYKSICSFTPISTLLLIAIAGSSCLIRSKKFK